MELTEKNGHASIEEILASVRRIIAEEPGSSAPLIDLDAPSHHPRGDGLLDDPSDFDLPSMFKTPNPTAGADRPAPLFGRLSEAIRSASQSNGYAIDPFRPDHALSALKLHRVEAGEPGGSPHFLLSTFHEATTPRPEDIAAAAMADAAPAGNSAPSPFAPAPTMATQDPGRSPADSYLASDRNDAREPAAPTPSPQVPRQMAAFKDTRFRSMGSSPVIPDPGSPFVSPFEATATAALVAAVESAAAPPSAAAAVEPLAPILMSVADDLVAMEAPAGLTAAIVASYPALASEPEVVELPAHIPPPVPVPPAAPVAAAPPAHAAETQAPIEDSTADLLRPMLRQWLAENMPRMVEKALHIEVAESGKTTKK